MHNVHCTCFRTHTFVFTVQPQNLNIFLSSCSSQSTACRFSVSDFQVILLPELLHNGCAEKSSVPPLSQRNTVYQSSSKGRALVCTFSLAGALKTIRPAMDPALFRASRPLVACGETGRGIHCHVTSLQPPPPATSSPAERFSVHV